MPQSLAAASKAADAVRRRLQLYREQSQSLPSGVPPPSPPPPPVDGLTLRARGWLRFLHRKACAPHGPGTHDDWSQHSPTGPHEWWDRVTGGPMSNFPRFDLHESAYAVLLYAQRTPAYRELYTAILDGLADRYRTHWSAVDFLNQFGPDDRSRPHYPEVWRGRLVPAESWREYDTPGWTANGCSPSATAAATAATEATEASAVTSLSDRAELDPLTADGMLFFKGWFALVLSIRAAVAGESGRWDADADGDGGGDGWTMAGVGGSKFRHTHGEMSRRLSAMFNANAGAGLH